MRKYLVFVSFLIVLLGFNTSTAQPALKVGTLVPFVGRSGDAGRECVRGMLDAARSLNQRGGVQGRRLEILLVDDTFQPAEMVAAFRKLNEVDNIPLASHLLQRHSPDPASLHPVQPHPHRGGFPAFTPGQPVKESLSLLDHPDPPRSGKNRDYVYF